VAALHSSTTNDPVDASTIATPTRVGSRKVRGRNRGKPVRNALLEQSIIHQRPGREHPRHRALHDSLGILRILDLIAHRNAKPLLDQASQVHLDLMVRNPRHGDTLGASRQRQAQGLVNRHRVIVERLVEISDAEQQDAIRVLPLKAGELAHRRSIARIGHAAGVPWVSRISARAAD
jgi:hypothetical protein